MSLLEYVKTPVRYELNIKPASLQISQKQVQSRAQTTPAKLEIQQEHVQIRTDSTQMFSSIGLKPVLEMGYDAAQRGRQAASEATANYADFGNSLKNIQKGANIPDSLFSQYMQRSSGDLVLIPLSPTDISFVPGSVQMQFTPQTTDIQWEPGRAQMEFVPGSVSLDILEHPAITFNFLGKPIYVPASAAPDA